MTLYNEGHTRGESSGMCVYGCKLHLEWWGVLIHTDWIVSLKGDSYCSCLTSSNVAGNAIAPKPACCRQSFASHFCCTRLFDQSDKCETLSERVIPANQPASQCLQLHRLFTKQSHTPIGNEVLRGVACIFRQEQLCRYIPFSAPLCSSIACRALYWGRILDIRLRAFVRLLHELHELEPGVCGALCSFQYERRCERMCRMVWRY